MLVFCFGQISQEKYAYIRFLSVGKIDFVPKPAAMSAEP